jgi:hypothetical protein
MCPYRSIERGIFAIFTFFRLLLLLLSLLLFFFDALSLHNPGFL